MRPTVAHVLTSLLLLAPAAAAQTWEPAPAFPTGGLARVGAVGVEAAGEVFAIGGSPFLNGDDADGSAHGLVPSSGVWVERAWVEGPVVGSGAGVDGLGRIVVFGGADALDPEGDLGPTYAWDPIEGKQGELADRSAGAPPTGFAWATDASGRLYSIGGGPGAGATAGTPNSTRVERYDALADVWSALAPLPEARAEACAAFDVHGRLVVVGGYDALGSGPLSSVLVYDPSTDAWASDVLPALPAGVAGARAARGSDGRVYVVGGEDGFGPSAATWKLDPNTGTWLPGPPLATPRKAFALALGPDARLYAMGGDDGVGGTAGVETLFTPVCPSIANPVDAVEAWAGLDAVLGAEVSGGAPFDLRWERDGQPLFDGPAPGGGVYLGTGTAQLRIDGVGPADAGSYRLTASNPCGTASGDAIALHTLEPPSIGPWVALQELTPFGVGASSARVAEGALVAGTGIAPAPPHPDQPQAVLWDARGAVQQTLTPSNSVGSGVAAFEGETLAGWWWAPYTVPQGTGYYQHAAVWTATTGNLTDIQPSGWEIGSVSDTDGVRHVGTLRWSDESTTVDAAFWPTGSSSAVVLTPSAAWGSSGAAIDGERQVGSVNLGFGVVHAAVWRGSAASYEDWNPPGSSWSALTAAEDGQVAGWAEFGGVRRAQLFGADAEDRVELHPAGATSSSLSDCEGGVQLGSVSFGAGSGGLALWRGEAEEWIDLAQVAAAGPWSSLQAYSVDVSEGGRVTVAGSGYDPVTQSSSGLLWRFQPEALVAEPAVLSLASGGTQQHYLAAGAEHGGELYLVLGSATGTAPGLPLAPGALLPLNVDAYTSWTLGAANGGVLDGTFGLLDSWGGARPRIVLPAGLPSNLAGVALDHAAVVFRTDGTVTLATAPAPLVLGP